MGSWGRAPSHSFFFSFKPSPSSHSSTQEGHQTRRLIEIELPSANQWMTDALFLLLPEKLKDFFRRKNGIASNSQFLLKML
jgi:hypothetical protein